VSQLVTTSDVWAAGVAWNGVTDLPARDDAADGYTLVMRS
jgi:hypothetical protein